MECLTPTASFDIFMGNYFTSSRLRTDLGVNNIRAIRVLNKNRLHKCTIIGNKQLQKRNMSILNNTHQANRRAIYIVSSESCEPKYLFGAGTKLKKSIYKSNNQINFIVTTRTWVLSIERTRTWPSTGLVFK